MKQPKCHDPDISLCALKIMAPFASSHLSEAQLNPSIIFESGFFSMEIRCETKAVSRNASLSFLRHSAKNIPLVSVVGYVAHVTDMKNNQML